MERIEPQRRNHVRVVGPLNGVAKPTEMTRQSNSTGIRGRSARALRWAIEGVVLLLVCLSPWAFGAGEPQFLFLLNCGVAVLAALWAAVLLVEGQLALHWCSVTLCLAALVLVGICQLIPLPGGTLRQRTDGGTSGDVVAPP